MKAYQVQVGDTLKGKEVISVLRDNKTKVRIKTKGQRRGILVHRSTELEVTTGPRGTGFGN